MVTYNIGTNNGGTFSCDRYGVPDRSIYFDGFSSYVEGINPGNNLPVGDSPRTISCWIKSSEAPSSRNIFHYGTAEVAPTNYHLFMQEGKYVGIGNGYGYGILISSNDIGDETWYFITTVYEGSSSNIQHIYINGKLNTSDVISTTPNTVLANNWRMGQFMGGLQSLLGSIDELKVYEIPLTEQEIWDHYKTTTTAPDLLFPGNDSTLINPPWPDLILDWDSTVTANEYRLLIANDSLFNTIVHDTLLNSSAFIFYDWPFVDIDNLFWKVRTINEGGIGPWSETNRFSIILTDIESEHLLPTEFALLQNYPNPFNPSTVITYQLPKASNVELKVYDVLGNEIKTLVNEEKPAGRYEVKFDASNLSSGMYLYVLKAAEFKSVRKLILIK